MKHVSLPVVILASLVSFGGCAKPCFHQAGKSVEQGKRDLVQCIDQARVQRRPRPAELTCSCMQAKGYERLDANKLSQDTKRIMVIAPFERYWVLDGLEAPSTPPLARQRRRPEPFDGAQGKLRRGTFSAQARITAASTAVSQEKPSENDRQVPLGMAKPTPAPVRIGYRARLDAAGKYIITPVYQHEQEKETARQRLANSGK